MSKVGNPKLQDPNYRSNASGVSKPARLAKTNLAIAVRQKVPAEVLVEFQLAIMQGQNPKLVEDKRCHFGWRIVDTCLEEGGIAPTLSDKKDAAKAIMERGWGMPAATLYLEQDIQAKLEITGTVVKQELLEGVDIGRLVALRQLFQPKALQGPETGPIVRQNAGERDLEPVQGSVPGEPETETVQDAEFTEV